MRSAVRRCDHVDAQRSNSAAMMFKLPSTATTSLSVWPRIKCGKQGEVDERRRPAAGPIGHVRCRRRPGKSPARRWALRSPRTLLRAARRSRGCVITSSKCEIVPFDRRIHLLLVGQRRPLVDADVHRARRQVLDRLLDDLQALAHLGHPHQVAGEAIAGRGAADLEIEIGVGQVRLVLAQIAGHAAGPGDRARCSCG